MSMLHAYTGGVPKETVIRRTYLGSTGSMTLPTALHSTAGERGLCNVKLA